MVKCDHYCRLATVGLAAALLSGCASQQLSLGASQEAPSVDDTALPASIPATDLLGQWGLAAFHREADRTRTEAAARALCSRQPYTIARGPSGGVMMHLPDQSEVVELRLKGGSEGKNYIGPVGQPAGGPQDREIVVFDDRVFITRFTDPEIAGRYGQSIYVRCGTGGLATQKSRKTSSK